MRYAIRYVMTRVFPDPAPARIITGPSVCRTASRCSGLSFSRKVIGGTDFQYNAEVGGRRSGCCGDTARTRHVYQYPSHFLPSETAGSTQNLLTMAVTQ